MREAYFFPSLMAVKFSALTVLPCFVLPAPVKEEAVIARLASSSMARSLAVVMVTAPKVPVVYVIDSFPSGKSKTRDLMSSLS